MTKVNPISALFVDIGGVFLTNGWDRNNRAMAASHFGLDLNELDSRHRLTFDTFEIGKISLDEYLYRIVFYEKRNFTMEEFKIFMFSQAEAFHEMIDLITKLKNKYSLKVVAVSNEGRELTEYRIKNFNLTLFIDYFIVSSFVHFRKPDTDIFKLAIDMAQTDLEQIIYIDDRLMFVEVAKTLGLRGIHHSDYYSTKKKLEQSGLIMSNEF